MFITPGLWLWTRERKYVQSFLILGMHSTLSHRSLVDKLQSIGLDQYILRWIVSYLSDKSQYVVFNGERSPTHTVMSGVPQESVLGPLLSSMTQYSTTPVNW